MIDNNADPEKQAATMRCSADEKYRITFMDRKAMKMLGYSEYEGMMVNGMSLLHLLHPNDYDLFRDEVERMIAGDEEKFRIRIRHMDCTYMQVSVLGKKFETPLNSEILLEVIDIESEKGDLQEIPNLYTLDWQLLLEGIPAGVRLFGREKHFETVFFNDYFYSVTEHSREDMVRLLGIKCAEVVEEDGIEGLIEDIYRMGCLELRKKMHYRMTRRDGVGFWVYELANYKLDKNGEAVGYSLLIPAEELENRLPHRAVRSEQPKKDVSQKIGMNRIVPSEKQAQRVRIDTFGYFDIFVEGRIVPFANEKAKEMLALLVDRDGAFVKNEELICNLWEEGAYNKRYKERLRYTKNMLMNTLQKYGAEDIIEKDVASMRICKDKVLCDLYGTFDSKFSGYYMNGYSWSEVTLARLDRKSE